MTETTEQMFKFIGSPIERAVAILAVSLLMAVVLRVLLLPLLRRAVRRSPGDFDDGLVDRFGSPVVATVVLLGIIVALVDLPLAPQVEKVGHSLIFTVLVLIWGQALINTGKLICEAFSKNSDRLTWIQPKTLPLVDLFLKLSIIGGQIYLILKAWHFDVTTWIASAGVAGLVIGLAAKDTLANLFSGMFILADAPYKVGDFIVLPDGLRGRVTDIGIRSTRLLTRDDIEVTLPNAVIGNSKVVNESSGPYQKMRVRVKVSVAYGSDVDEVERILLSTTAQVIELAKSPAPRVRFRSFDDSGLAFELLAWVDEPVLRGRAIHNLNRGVYIALGDAGVEIPYPKRDLYIKELPTGADGADKLGGSQ